LSAAVLDTQRVVNALIFALAEMVQLAASFLGKKRLSIPVLDLG
jgi:hypothetical protein